jgi:hypothetical protein
VWRESPSLVGLPEVWRSMKPTYSELLRDPRWQRKRLEILNRSNFTCEECEAGDKTLNVHHKHYRKGAKPWEYEDHELVALCEECHHGRHELEKMIQVYLGEADTHELEVILGFLEARYIVDDEDTDQSGTLILRNKPHLTGVAAALGDPLRSFRELEKRFAAGQTKLTGREAYELSWESFGKTVEPN